MSCHCKCSVALPYGAIGWCAVFMFFKDIVLPVKIRNKCSAQKSKQVKTGTTSMQFSYSLTLKAPRKMHLKMSSAEVVCCK